MNGLDKRDQIVNDPGFLQKLCDHVTCGGTVVGFCRDADLAYNQCMKYINADDERKSMLQAAYKARKEYTTELLLEEIKDLSTMNIADIYDSEGKMLPLHRMPLRIQKAIKSIDFDMDSGKAKIQFIDKLKALETHAKTTDMLVQKVEVSANETLEQIIGKSFKVDNDKTD